MLQVRSLDAFYGKSQILRHLDLDVREKEIVSVLGRNGSGRSTILKAIMGGVQAAGSIRFQGKDIIGLKPFQIARSGIGYVPENRAIFPDLTVVQNLRLGEKRRSSDSRWGIRQTWEAFPQLFERANIQAGVLSGGEQQMLTICRTLMGDPGLIMIDEPTEGLAPEMVERVADLLKRIAAQGIAILLVEQKLTIALSISHRVYVMGHGQMVFAGTPSQCLENVSVRKEWLEV
jgi:branched-chain amino acid transport system ATP-binding protein